MANNSAKPILVAGAVGTVVLLGAAWMFAASTSEQAVINAQQYAEARTSDINANFNANIETDDGGAESGDKPVEAGTEASKGDDAPAAASASRETEPEAEQPAETEVAAAEPEAEKPEETETVVAAVTEAEAEAEEPAPTETAEATEEQPAESEVAAAAADERPEPETATATEESAAAVETDAPPTEEVAAAPAADAEPAADAATTAAAAPAAVETASLDGDPKAGAKVFRKCKACHKIGDGANNAVGPYLTGVVGRTIGAVDGFKYSDGFQTAMAEGKKWTPEELDAFLLKPKDYIPGTKMAFGGLRKDEDRADVIAYLATDGE